MIRLLILSLALTTPTWAAGDHPLEAPLAAATQNARAAKALGLVYDDVHGLYGGDRYTLAGRVLTHVHQPRGGQPPIETRVTLTPIQLQELAVLLQTQALWDQREPERKPRPDESRARLTITADGASAQVWEWYNDLAANDRLIRVRALLDRWSDGGAP